MNKKTILIIITNKKKKKSKIKENPKKKKKKKCSLPIDPASAIDTQWCHSKQNNSFICLFIYLLLFIINNSTSFSSLSLLLPY